jgi:hypothetical protein
VSKKCIYTLGNFSLEMPIVRTPISPIKGFTGFYTCSSDSNDDPTPPGGDASCGKLYDWATAMALPAKCNTTLSTSDPECAIQNKHRGICPSGQHIPSKEELEEYGSYGCLKNQPGGYGNFGGYFLSVGLYGYWWSSSESSSNYAYCRDMNYYGEGVSSYYSGKSSLHSVRCLKD